jgi:ABC-type uncharacterized transport system involved in gliding motility auxiliary subunit
VSGPEEGRQRDRMLQAAYDLTDFVDEAAERAKAVLNLMQDFFLNPKINQINDEQMVLVLETFKREIREIESAVRISADSMSEAMEKTPEVGR